MLIFESTKLDEYKIVYRVEHSITKEGPYLRHYLQKKDKEFLYSWADEVHNIETGRPSSIDDPGFNQQEKLLTHRFILKEISPCPYRYGFSSIKQLKKWFRPMELARLLKLGYAIRTYRASRIWDSGTQAIFEPYSEEILTKTPKELTKLDREVVSEYLDLKSDPQIILDPVYAIDENLIPLLIKNLYYKNILDISPIELRTLIRKMNL
jgi:hypothetical protein